MERRLFIVRGRLPLPENSQATGTQADFFTHTSAMQGENWVKQFDTIFNVGISTYRIDEWIRNATRDKAAWQRSIPVFLNNSDEQECSSKRNIDEVAADKEVLANQTRINRAFANNLLPHLRPADTVAISGYGLSLLPLMLRKEKPKIGIGLFLPGSFRPTGNNTLASETSLRHVIDGISGSDLVGFDNDDAMTQFIDCISAVKETSHTNSIITLQDRIIKTIVVNSEQPVQDFMINLRQIKQKQENFRLDYLDDYSRIQLYDEFRGERNRTIILDYDCFLSGFHRDELNQLLHTLNARCAAKLILLSSETKEWLESTTENIDAILIAESGKACKAEKKWSVDKNEMERILDAQQKEGFILAMAANQWTESVFTACNQNPSSFTIKIGDAASYAKYNLQTPGMSLALLTDLSHFDTRFLATG